MSLGRSFHSEVCLEEIKLVGTSSKLGNDKRLVYQLTWSHGNVLMEILEQQESQSDHSRSYKGDKG